MIIINIPNTCIYIYNKNNTEATHSQNSKNRQMPDWSRSSPEMTGDDMIWNSYIVHHSETFFFVKTQSIFAVKQMECVVFTLRLDSDQFGWKSKPKFRAK